MIFTAGVLLWLAIYLLSRAQALVAARYDLGAGLNRSLDLDPVSDSGARLHRNEVHRAFAVQDVDEATFAANESASLGTTVAWYDSPTAKETRVNMPAPILPSEFTI